jgi:L,D-transpeptidase ErfK/SrfK
MFISSLHGCAGIRGFLVKPPPHPGRLEEKIERNDFFLGKGEEVVGRLAAIRLEKDDTLPDIARHFSLGINTVQAANPGTDIWVPEAGERILLPLSFILPDTPRKGIVINVAAMRLFHFKGDGEGLAVSTYPVGVGTPERPSPTCQTYVKRKIFRPTWYVPASIAEDHRKRGDPLPAKVPPGPLNPLGEHALYLNSSRYLVHGTNKPASIGLRATNGCIRLYPEDMKRLFENTPMKTPVRIVNQPYLVGQRDGTVYVEAHRPLKGSTAELKKAYTKLRDLEKKSGRRLDWKKVDKVVAEACGIPVPIFETHQGSEKEPAGIVELKHPENLYGKPEIPRMTADAWYVLAAVLRHKVEALRLAAILNHQGPQIPARVLSKSDMHRVIAGPFKNVDEARDAANRLRTDLGIEAVLLEPGAEGKPIAPCFPRSSRMG